MSNNFPWQSTSCSSKFYPDLGNQTAAGVAAGNCYLNTSSSWRVLQMMLPPLLLLFSDRSTVYPPVPEPPLSRKTQLQFVNPELGINLLQVIRACVVHCGFYALKPPWEHSIMATFFLLLFPVPLKMLFSNYLNSGRKGHVLSSCSCQELPSNLFLGLKLAKQ